MTKQGIETYNEDGQWKSRRAGKEKAFSVVERKQQATGRDAVKRGSVEQTIKKLDGTIGGKNSYGNDPESAER